VGLGENEMSNGCAVESEWRWNNGSTAIGVLGVRIKVAGLCKSRR